MQPLDSLLHSEPIMDAIAALKDNLISYNKEHERSMSEGRTQWINPNAPKITSQYYPAAPPQDAASGPNYMIRRIVPPLKLNKVN